MSATQSWFTPVRISDAARLGLTFQPRAFSSAAIRRLPYMTYPPPSISRWDEDGFSSCSACPCHRAVPNTPPECFIASVSLRRFMLPSPNRWGLGFRFKEFRGHLWVHFRYGPVTRSPSLRWLCQSASSDSFPRRMRPKLRGSDFYPGGTVSH